MKQRMKQKEEQGTMSFHISKKAVDKFNNWISHRMIVRERLWEMIIDDLIKGDLYDIPERFKPKISVHFKDENEKVIKTINIELNKRMGQGGPDPESENEDQTER